MPSIIVRPRSRSPNVSRDTIDLSQLADQRTATVARLDARGHRAAVMLRSWRGHQVSEAKFERMENRITIDAEICGGRPCIRGLRIRVKDVLELLASGASHDEILEDYPYLEADDIVAVLQFAASQSDHPVLRTAS